MRPEHQEIDAFAISVRDKATRTGYHAGVLDRLMKDAFIFTVNDAEIITKLLEIPSTTASPLTFSRAVETATAMYKARKHAATVGSKGTVPTAARMGFRSRKQVGGAHCGCNNGSRADGDQALAGGDRPDLEDRRQLRCDNCGERRHSGDEQCPAKGKRCGNCGGASHFRKMCHLGERPRDPRAAAMEDGDGDEEEETLAMSLQVL
jgi:hypothetical protein